METKANYLLIGLFTLLGMLGLMGFVAWFSKVELDKQVAYYDVYFPNVSGLDRASTVKFAGLAVGQVVDLELADSRDGTVRVVLEVAADTPVRASSEATIEAQGVTGVSFVGISAGGEGEAFLTPKGGAKMATIPAGKSALQTLTEDAPQIIDKTLAALDTLNAFLSDENRQNVDKILRNLASSSDELDETLKQFSAVAVNVGDSVNEIASFTDELSGISQSVTGTLQIAESALTTIDAFADKASTTLDAGTRMIDSANDTVQLAGDFIDTEISTLVEDLTVSSATLRARAETLSDGAVDLFTAWTQTGQTAEARLAQSEGLFDNADTMIAQLTETLRSMDAASTSFDQLMTSDGTDLVRRAARVTDLAEQAMVPLTQTLERDLPQILEILNRTAARVETTVNSVGADLTASTGRIDGLSDSATQALDEAARTFARANATLDALDGALGQAGQTLSVADDALEAATGAFTGAEQMVSRDLSPVTQQLRDTMARVNAALDDISADIPAVTQSLRSAAARTDAAAGDIAAMVGQVDGPLSDFAKGGLPQYTFLADDMRKLVRSLEILVSKIERDPARFFLGADTPTYRRR